jgi:hypothetical protein
LRRKDQNNSLASHPPQIGAAILNAMQHVHPDTYIGPLENEMEEQMIYQVDDIPLQEGATKLYLATPINTKQKTFVGKIYMHTNHTFQEYQQNPILTEYMKKENIILDINDLDDINPITIGFLENCIPRYETLDIQTKRLQALLPISAPKIQLQFGILWGKAGEQTRVVLIKCDEHAVDYLVKQIEEVHSRKEVSFFYGEIFYP